MAKAPILNPVQQRFVSAILEGKSQSEAYKAAGYPGCHDLEPQKLRSRANQVARRSPVASTLARAQASQVERLSMTSDTIVDQLLEARQIALTTVPVQANAAVAASMGIAKILGLVVDRAELNITRNKPSLFPTAQLELSEDEWKRQFSAPSK